MFYLILFFALMFSSQAGATTYYIATTGSDANNCTQAQSVSTPKATFANVFANCMTGGGHTLKVVAGTYTQFIDDPPSGTSGAPTIIEGNTAGFGTWTLQPANCNANDGAVVGLNGRNWVTIRGFVGNASPCSMGIRLLGSSNDNVFEDFELFGILNVTNNSGYTATITSHRNTLRNCKIHDFGDPTLDHGVYFSGDGNLLEFCEIYNIQSHGVHIYPGSSGVRAEDNIVRFNWIHDTAIGIGSYISDRSQIYGNWIVDSSSDALRLTTGSTAAKYYNNVAYSNSGQCASISGSSNSFYRNNLCLSNGTNTMSGGTGNTFSNNTSSTDANLVVNVATNDFGPRAGSALIDAGVSAITTGVTRPFNGAAPDIGAMESFTCSSASVNGNTMDVTCSMAFNVPLLPATGITGFTVNNGRSVTSAVRVGDSIVRLTFDGAACDDLESWTFAYSGGNVTDSALIGGSKNQALHTIGATAATNNCEGAPAPPHDLQISNYQIYDLRMNSGALEKLPRNAAVNTPAYAIPGAPFVVESQLDCTLADCPSVGPVLGYIKNGGSWTQIPATPAGSGIHFYGTGDTSSDIPTEGAAVAACLAGALTDIAGSTIRAATAIPTVDLAQNQCISLRHVVKADSGVVATDIFEFELRNQDGTVLNAAPTVKPKMTFIGNQGSAM